MIPFTLNEPKGKKEWKFTLPESWEEVTLAQLIKFDQEQKLGDVSLTMQLEILTGIPSIDWFNCTIISLDKKLMPYLKWLREPITETTFQTFRVPKEVTIAGQVYKVPADIDLCTLGQKITFQNQMASYIRKDPEENITGFELPFYPIAIAIYLYPDKPFSDVKALEFAKEVEKLPLATAYPLASFFLRRFLESSNETVTSSPTLLMQKNKKQVSIS